MSNPVPFKNIMNTTNPISYYDSKGNLWLREEIDGYFHFLREVNFKKFVEVGYMKASKSSIKTVHEAFIQ